MHESQQHAPQPSPMRRPREGGSDTIPRVALETVVFAHGLPRDESLPCFREMITAVRDQGAEPAACAILEGTPTVGLSPADLERLMDAHPEKISPSTLACAAGLGKWGATTAGAAMMLAHGHNILTLATGGIGGVHRGTSWDVSGDLRCLAELPMVVVCSGAKSILDVEATLEVLETLGVAVVGYGTSEVPAFYTASTGISVPHRVDSPEEVASIWRAARALGSTGSVLVLNPPPHSVAFPPGTVEKAVTSALAVPCRGPSATPTHLADLQRRLGPQSVRLNRALLVENARCAARISRLIPKEITYSR